MFFLIVAAIINSTNAQVAAPVQKPTANQNNQNAQPDRGATSYEEYTDSDGNIKKHGFKYGFQYGDTYKNVKPSGQPQKETYTKDGGDLSERSYKYGFQYGEEDSGNPIKLKSPKMAAPPENADSSYAASSPSSNPSDSSASPSSSPTSANPLAPTPGDIKQKDADILNKMKDLIKARNELKAGAK